MPIHSRERSIAFAAGATIEQLEVRRFLSVLPVRTPGQLKIPSTWKAAPEFHDISNPDAGSKTASGLTPAQMEGAYGVNKILFGSVAGNGGGQTIAIVDAYNYSTALNDLNAFSTNFGLPTFNNASGGGPTFTQYNQSGSSNPSTLPGNDPAGAGDDWEVEEALDIEWAHAIAPEANIDLVEANDASNNLYTADQAAANLPGVSVVSNSWSGAEFSTESSTDGIFVHAGVTFCFATGDDGAYASGSTKIVPQYPATSPDVLAVGGTVLSIGASNTYSSETAWGDGTLSYKYGGGGGGISKYESIPSFQSGKINGASSTNRTYPDVSMNADTGVPIYDTYDYSTSGYPWGEVGGTSLACPMWGGLIAIVNQGRAIAGVSALTGATQTLPDLYNLPSTDFHDITTGNNGYAATTGYDLATGIGTPVANLLVTALQPPVLTTNPVSQSLNVGQDAKFVAAATGSTSVQWMVEPAGSSTFSSITGATATTLDLGAATLAENGNEYEAVFSNGSGTSTTSTPATLTVVPVWLSATSVATWNATTHILSISGATTIISDPGSDEPTITGTASIDQVKIAPTVSDQDIHIGGINLTGGAGIDMVSVGAARSHTNHNVLVLGASGVTSAPQFAIASTSKLNLEDNDMIIHDGASEFSSVQAAGKEGRNAPDSLGNDGPWNGNGLTSSTAAALYTDNSSEITALAITLNSDLAAAGVPSSSLVGFTSWTVGSASEPVGSNDVIIKYTYYGDQDLEGYIGQDDVNAVHASFTGNTLLTAPANGYPNDDWAFGDFTGSGEDNQNDVNGVQGAFGYGEAGSGLPQL